MTPEFPPWGSIKDYLILKNNVEGAWECEVVTDKRNRADTVTPFFSLWGFLHTDIMSRDDVARKRKEVERETYWLRFISCSTHPG